LYVLHITSILLKSSHNSFNCSLSIDDEEKVQVDRKQGPTYKDYHKQLTSYYPSGRCNKHPLQIFIRTTPTVTSVTTTSMKLQKYCKHQMSAGISE